MPALVPRISVTPTRGCVCALVVFVGSGQAGWVGIAAYLQLLLNSKVFWAELEHSLRCHPLVPVLVPARVVSTIPYTKSNTTFYISIPTARKS